MRKGKGKEKVEWREGYSNVHAIGDRLFGPVLVFVELDECLNEWVTHS